ncbi:MAG: YicC/YloC family endoribonuclease [Planctomycetota bacterium]
MIRSMTGYGNASAQHEGVQFSLELRSLNNRYFKASTRLPDEIAGLEAILESELRRRVNRGSFSLTVKVKVSDAAATSAINDQALLTYLDHLETVREKVQDESVQIDLTQLLALPGVLQPKTDDDALLAKAKATVPQLLNDALDRLVEMRTTEGKALAEDLLSQVDHIREQIAVVAERAPVVVDEYHQRLTARVDELMAKAKLKVDENDLLREVAVFADRADISEEISRMTGHLDQFTEIIQAPSDVVGNGKKTSEPAGRTLDFIAQEMLREANTIGSKSNDTPISRAVVEIKSRIDRIKEQVQNVE